MNYIDLILEEAEDYLYNEGTNFDLMKIKRDHIKPIKEKLRRVKILVKNGDRNTAIDVLNDIIDDLKSIKGIVAKCDDSLLEQMIGSFVGIGWFGDYQYSPSSIGRERMARDRVIKPGDMVNPYRAKVYNIIDEKIELCQKIIQNIRSGTAYNKLEK